ncbi:MAG: tail-specific protease, partial [Bacteroidetes bacterium]|nr:tail-specific protease [Bacteroidota bacterium]
MKSRKGLVLTAVVLFGALFFAFKVIDTRFDRTDLTQRQRLLTAIGSLLESEHYSPKTINDAFSKEVFKKYLTELDGEKIIFLQSDINSFKKFETTIDDEIHGAPILFAPTVSAVYAKRIAEVVSLYKEILATPFIFTIDETAVLDGDKLSFAGSEAEKKDRMRKTLKFLSLE